MNKLNETIKTDLAAVAEKHGLSYDSLALLISDEVMRENRLEDIRYTLENHFDEVAVTEANLALIYDRLQYHEDSEYGIWDNIQNAVNWVYDDLEKKEED